MIPCTEIATKVSYLPRSCKYALNAYSKCVLNAYLVFSAKNDLTASSGGYEKKARRSSFSGLFIARSLLTASLMVELSLPACIMKDGCHMITINIDCAIYLHCSNVHMLRRPLQTLLS